MGMSIRTNVSALDAQKNLMGTETTSTVLSRSCHRAFVLRKRPDDAAGLAISVNLGAQIKSYNQAVRNGNDALNVVQTADSSLNETQNIMTRLRELASQSASSGVSNTERGYIQNEVGGLVSEVDRIANATEYNGVALLNSRGGADLPGRHPQRGLERSDRRDHGQRDLVVAGIELAFAVDPHGRAAGVGHDRHRAAIGLVHARDTGRAGEPVQHGDQRRDSVVGVAVLRPEPYP